MKKLTAIIISVLVLCSVLSFACAAAGEMTESVTGEEITSVDGDGEEIDADFTPDDAEQTEDGKENKANPFEAVFLKVKEHSDTIFSALTLVGSIILAFTYKKGLLPALGSSLAKIGDSVKKIGDATEMSIVRSDGAILDIDDKIRDIGELFEKLDERLTELNDRMSAVDDERAQSEKTRIIMRSQVDMLYDIFMTSSLPQYSKDAVGEKIAAMKLLLEKGED